MRNEDVTLRHTTLANAAANPPVEPVAEYVVRTDAKGKTGGICYLRRAAYDLKEGSYLLYTSMPPAKMLTVDEGQAPTEVLLLSDTEKYQMIDHVIYKRWSLVDLVNNTEALVNIKLGRKNEG